MILGFKLVFGQYEELITVSLTDEDDILYPMEEMGSDEVTKPPNFVNFDPDGNSTDVDSFPTPKLPENVKNIKKELKDTGFYEHSKEEEATSTACTMSMNKLHF